MARKSAHHFAILTGASISSARLGKIKLPQRTPENLDNNDPRIRCTRCQECGTHDHQMWGCPGNPFTFTAPHEPFQRRLGWPTSNNEEYNNVVLDHMARTRQQLLALATLNHHVPHGQPHHLVSCGRSCFDTSIISVGDVVLNDHHFD